ncbi:MAG: hypothetical protein JEZ02_00675 [Desulfatibacillum sp.]|nr:hypothetical protein [Desulfatibacillum sp.]
MFSYGLKLFLLLCMVFGAAFGPVSGQANESVLHEIQQAMTKGDDLFARFHEDTDNLARAGTIYQNVLEKNPNFVEAVWKLSEVQYLLGMFKKDLPAEKEYYEKCLELANRALAIDPASVPALFYSGCSQVSLAKMVGPLKALGLLKKGKAELLDVMDQGTASRFAPLAASVLSQVNTETPWPMRDLNEAESLSLQAVEWDPDLTMARVQLARVYLAKKEYAQAAKEAENCLATDKPTYMSDAVVWDWPAAREILSKAKEMAGG